MRKMFIWIGSQVEHTTVDTAILDFRLPVWSHSIETTSVELLDPKNMGVAVGISFLSLLEAEILGGWYPLPLGPSGKPEITF